MPKKPKLFERVAIMGRKASPNLAAPITALAAFLAHRKHKVLIESETAAMTGIAHLYPTVTADALPSLDLLIVIGGDGTLLSAARKIVASSLPIIGVNQGRFGFLTDIPLIDMEAVIGDVLDGYYTEEKRTMLMATLSRPNQAPVTLHALNDIAINRGATHSVLDFSVSLDNVLAYTLRADGLIVSTPTGSTAYALSAGGPILPPTLSAVVLVPVAPYGLTHRPVILPDQTRMTIAVKGAKTAILCADSQTHIEMREDMSVTILKSPHTLNLLHPKDYDYFSALREKLHWSKMPERSSRDAAPFSLDDDQE
ncbi:MAG: NAD(+)/NADH kinase [Burkholderiales bacterium]|jgi:NAD+ kinase|nr:NAD(+)/NADH kinase [Burkholderiales bacterium]